MSTSMKYRRSLAWTDAAAVLICAGVVAFNITAVQSQYHDWRMRRAWHQMATTPPLSDEIGQYISPEIEERYYYHLQKLVDLGAITEREYSMKHLRAPTEESNDLVKLIQSGACPKSTNFSAVHPDPDQPEPMRLTLRCYPDDAAAWDAFIAQHDVSDYRQRFMPSIR